jgi:hypothetical protein
MKELLNRVPQKNRLLVAAIVSLLSMSLTAKAAVITGTEVPNATYFGVLGQLNSGVTNKNSLLIRPFACVPTATINGLTYLYNYATAKPPNGLGLANVFSVSPNTYLQINYLAAAMGTFNNNVTTTNFQYYAKNLQGKSVLVYTSLLAPADAAQLAALTATFGPLTTKAVNGAVIQQGGTLVNSMYNGLASYLSATGKNPAPTVVITGQQQPSGVPGNWYATSGKPPAVTPIEPKGVVEETPTAAYLAEALDKNAGVEIMVQWGTYATKGGLPVGPFTPLGGAHELTLDYISLNTTTDMGTIGYLNPEPTTTATAAKAFTSKLTLAPGGYLYFSIPGSTTDVKFGGFPGAGGDPSGRITSDMVESLPAQNLGAPSVPDSEATLLILGLSIAGLAAFRRLPHRI